MKYLLATGPAVRMGGQGGLRGQRPAPSSLLGLPSSLKPLRPQPQPFSPPPSSPPRVAPILTSALPGLPSETPTHTPSPAGSSPCRLWSTQNESQVGFHPDGPRFANQRRSFNAQLPIICLRPPRPRAEQRVVGGHIVLVRPSDWPGPVGPGSSLKLDWIEVVPAPRTPHSLSITPSLR